MKLQLSDFAVRWLMLATVPLIATDVCGWALTAGLCDCSAVRVGRSVWASVRGMPCLLWLCGTGNGPINGHRADWGRCGMAGLRDPRGSGRESAGSVRGQRDGGGGSESARCVPIAGTVCR